VAAAAGLTLGFGVILQAWPGLPSRIPTRFDPAGAPTAWARKGLLLILAGAALLAYVPLSLARLLPARFLNTPWPLTAGNAARQLALAHEFLALLKVEIVWLFAAIDWAAVRSVSDRRAAADLEVIVLVVSLAAILSTVGIYLYRSFRAR